MYSKRFPCRILLAVVVVSRQILSPFAQQTNDTGSSNDSETRVVKNRIKVPILRIITGLYMDYGMQLALDLVKLNATLNSTFEFDLTWKTSERALSKGIGPTLKVFVEAVTQPNETYAFLVDTLCTISKDVQNLLLNVGPDWSPEIFAIAQLTPIYNLVALNGRAALDVFSDKTIFPLFFRAGPKSADFTQAVLGVIKTFQINKIVTLAVNEDYFVNSIRSLEQKIDKIGVHLQRSAIFAQTNRIDVIESIVKIKPNYIVNALYGATEAQFYCDLYHAGLSSAQQTIYIMFGPFGIGNWWLPVAKDPTMHCTWQEMSTLLNGSIAIETLYDDASDAEESNKTKIGGLNGWQLNKLLLQYEGTASLGSRVGTKYTPYDSMWSAFDALYRTERRMRTELNASLAVALGSSCKSEAYKQYVSVFVQELRTTKFYGLTGDFGYDSNQDRLLDLRIYQFQSNATDAELVTVGSHSIENGSTTMYNEKLRFATPDNSPPHIWLRTLQDEAVQQSRVRLSLIVVGVTIVAVVGVAVAVTLLYRKRLKQLTDSRWIILAANITQVSQHRRSRLLSSMGGMQSMQSIPLSTTNSTTAYENSERIVRIASSGAANSSTFFEAWTRKFPKTNIPGGLNDGEYVRLNKVFPCASVLYAISHPNINRFVGMCVDMTKNDDNDAMLLYDYAAKSSLRQLLHNETFTLDLGLKHGFMYDIVSAVQFVHSRPAAFGGGIGFLHCNNIVLDNKFTAKLTDYDFWNTRPATDFMPLRDTASLAQLSDAELANALSRAPELLLNGFKQAQRTKSRKETREDEEISKKTIMRADIYSLGMVYVELFTRGLPFAVDASDRQQMESALLQQTNLLVESKTVDLLPLITAESAAEIDEQIRQLIQQCTSVTAAARPSAPDVAKAIRQLPNYAAGSVVENLITRLQSYANNLEDIVADRTTALMEEINRSEQLLLQILPPSVAKKLKAGEAVEPETFDEVSIYFSDIVGFTQMSSELTPMQVIAVLNSLYTLFDFVVESFDVYKVETIGDAYMVASGLPIRNDHQHLTEIAHMSIKLLEEIQFFKIPNGNEQQLLLRIGLHTGPCVAGVVGSKMPRYCLFGDTINTASRMESTGQALKIHISEAYKKTLDAYFPKMYEFEERGVTSVKGKGEMRTYWLVLPKHA